MKILLSTLLPNLPKYSLIGFLIALLFPIIGAIFIWLNKDNFPLAIPFWYSKPFSEEQLAAPNFLWLIPTISIFLVTTNFVLANILSSKERLLSLLLIWASPIVSGLLFISLLEVVLVST